MSLNYSSEEVVKAIKEIQKREEEDLKNEIERKRKERKGFDWDIPIDCPISCFDDRLSFELTGYKPINSERGLDFEPEWFTEAREVFLRTGNYTSYRPNTKAFADFWTQEYIRCRDGMESHGYTITGDHYFFLNYYQLLDLTSAKKAGTSRMYDFPRFFVCQYEWFHYLELCKRLLKNAALMKSRGVGFSEASAAISANIYNSQEKSVTVIAATQDVYVSKTLDKVWKALDFLNDKTCTGFLKLRQVKDTEYLKKSSHYKMVNGQKVEEGWGSQIQGIVADKPNKIRGDRTDLLIYEEGGSWPKSKTAFIQGDALVGVQGSKFGIKIIGGTGGDSGPSLEGLRDIYYHPNVYDVLPYRHCYTPTGEETQTAFFIPAFKLVNKPGYIDNRGYTDPEKGKEFYNAQRDLKAEDPQALITYSAEYCFTAEEAFSLEGDNKFNKVLIAEQLASIRLKRNIPVIDHGHLEYTFKEGGHTYNNITGFKWLPSIHGKVHILEHPIWTKSDKNSPSSQPIKDLYVAGIDSIDIGSKDTSSFTKDPSQFCIVIYKRVYGLSEPQIVAYYKDRPDDVREAYKIALRLCEYYNAMVNVEATRMSIISWARDHNYLKWFMKRPRATFPDPTKVRRNTYGTPATPAIINHQTDLISDFVNDYCHTIWFEDVLDELNRYTDDNKTKFDIIAALGMALLADEELNGVVPRAAVVENNTFKDIGYYRDENGIKRYGIIPNNNNKKAYYDPYHNSDNDLGIRSSDPRKLYGYL